MRPAPFRIPLAIAAYLAFVPAAALGQDTLTDDVVSDPAQAEFVFDDVRHFLEAMEELDGVSDSASVLQSI